MPGGESAPLNPEFLRSAEFKSQGQDEPQDAGSRQSQCSVTQTAWGLRNPGWSEAPCPQTATPPLCALCNNSLRTPGLRAEL